MTKPLLSYLIQSNHVVFISMQLSTTWRNTITNTQQKRLAKSAIGDKTQLANYSVICNQVKFNKRNPWQLTLNTKNLLFRLYKVDFNCVYYYISEICSIFWIQWSHITNISNVKIFENWIFGIPFQCPMMVAINSNWSV